jgi:hypothetical protein
MPIPHSRLSGCDHNNYHTTNTETLNPGVYCGGMQLNVGPGNSGSANVTLNPGIYYLDGGSLTVNAGTTLTGTGVTLVFTGSGNDWRPRQSMAALMSI